jgi:ABC-type glycerol-3-phosphate transport system substrate-binding protein
MRDKTFDGWWKYSEKNKEIYNNGNVGVLVYDFVVKEFTPITISPDDFLTKYQSLQEGQYDMEKKHILQTDHPGWPAVKKLYD